MLREVLGLTFALGLWWWPFRDCEASWEAHYRLQVGWLLALLAGARKLLGIRLEIENREALEEGGFLLLLRHASVVDALLPGGLVGRSADLRLRYVIKEELRIDPRLDIVGNRLPNAFARRQRPLPPSPIFASTGIHGLCELNMWWTTRNRSSANPPCAAHKRHLYFAENPRFLLCYDICQSPAYMSYARDVRRSTA